MHLRSSYKSLSKEVLVLKNLLPIAPTTNIIRNR